MVTGHRETTLRGLLREDLTTRAAYVSDASLYRHFPAAVLEPRGVEDVRAGLALARERGWPVVARGGGTSVAGNAISHGLVIDHSRHHRGVLAIDPQARTARVEPGVVADALTAAALPHGLVYGPDPSTHSRCTVGGMVANNACGSHSIAWGTSAQNLRTVRLLLADGREIAAGQGWCSDPAIETALGGLVAEHEDLIRAELGRFPRQVSGYGLHYLLPEHGFDVAKALAGSEGTLGVFTELTVDLVEPPAHRALVVLGYPDVYAAAAAAPRLLRPGVYTVEGMGIDLIRALRTRPGRERAGAELPPGNAWLYCEVGASSAAETMAQARDLEELARRTAQDHPALKGATTDAGLESSETPAADESDVVATAPECVIVTDPETRARLWGIREAAAGIATRRADGAEAWPGWEDSAVPAEHLASYLRDLDALMARRELQGIPFGHFGHGCIHVRIDFDLATPAGIEAYRGFVEEAADLVASYGGSMSGEHGDGRARSELLPRMYSPQMLALFRRFKEIFDPGYRFNPGVLVDPEPLDAAIRADAGLRIRERPTVHALANDGGSLARAVSRCVGVGKCRDGLGAMCPSYQATRDEVHSTRGRARVLAEMLRGERLDGYDAQEVLEALDLCLSCKACATECPVGVDMAVYKSEFLHQHYQGRRRPMAHYAMGWLPATQAAMAQVPGLATLANRVLGVDAVATVVKKLAGIEANRSMIAFAPTTLTQWYAARPRPVAPAQTPRGTVLLWPDTFTNGNAPHVGIAATEVLEALGYRVVLPRRPVCCGLTWHSTGQLEVSRAVLSGALDAVSTELREGWPIVVLEPSCATSLAEATHLLPDDPRAALLERQVTTLAELVAAYDGPWPFRDLGGQATLQVHCHQRATRGAQADLAVLERLGVRPDVITAGCCGLAGNFGFEPGHWEVSQACAERELFPTIRTYGAGRFVVADGFSCRTQIAQGTDQLGRHLAELLRIALLPAPQVSQI